LGDARCARGGFVRKYRDPLRGGAQARQGGSTNVANRFNRENCKKPSIHSWDNRRATMIAASLCVFCEFAEAFSHELETI
jgi:hypothetical protein